MQNIKRPNNAPMGIAVLFLSLAILPVSFKATGFKVELNPSFQSVIDAWGHMANALRSGDQSYAVMRISALNFNNAPDPLSAPDDASYRTASLIEGQAESLEAACCVEKIDMACSKGGESGCSQMSGDCPKVKRQPARKAKRVELAIANKAELATDFNPQRMEVVRALHSITPVREKLEEHIERYFVGYEPGLGRSLKDLRVRKIKVAKAGVQIQSGIFDCDFRKLMRPRRETAPAAPPTTTVRVVEAPISTAEGAQA
jgi:hypothetical protein